MTENSLVARAAAALGAGDHDGAVSLLRRALAEDPHDADALIASAKMARADGDLPAARELAARAAQAGPSNPAAWVLRAELDHAAGDTDAALTGFRAAQRLAPDNAAVLLNIGLLHYVRAEFEASARVYGQALELDPGNDVARRNAIMALAATGDIDTTAGQCKAYLADKRGSGLHTDCPPLPDEEAHTTRFKLEHDREQLLYLLGRGALDDSFSTTVDAYAQAIADLHGVDANTHVRRAEMKGEHWRTLERTYNRPVHLPEIAAPDPLINPDLEIDEIEARYRAGDPHIVCVDDLLAPDALTALREFLYRATIWYDIKPNYLGAYFIEGFANRLTLGIAEALRNALPGVFGEHRLTQAWAYKYGPRLTGIPVHADAAAVNVNLWIAPRHANLDPAGGGLRVYRSQAPRDWNFDRFNADQAAIRAFLGEKGSDHVTIAHACNRAVIFDSNLFHETDRIRFVDEYQSRRTNVTMLYGVRAA